MNILVKLILAHVLTDFFLQPNSWVADKAKNKEKSIYLYIHVLITALVAWLFLFQWSYWWIALIILITHYFIDVAKLKYGKKNAISFIVDQLAHIAVLFICVILIDKENVIHSLQIAQIVQTENLILILGYLVVTSPFGYLIGLATQHWRLEIAKPPNEQENNKSQQIVSKKKHDSLEKAGIWIGILERILVLTFVLLGTYEAIGFLIAAKSILRFSDKDENYPRKQTEYVLIGTLLSFSAALFIGLLILSLR